MIIIGLVVFAAAVAAAIILIAQNNNATLDVHALGHTSNVHAYWLVVAGLIITAVGLGGLAMMRSGGARYRRLRREHRMLVRDHERLADSYASGYPANDDAATMVHPQPAHQLAEPVRPMPPAGSGAASATRNATTDSDVAADAPNGSGRLGRLIHPRHRRTEGQPTAG